MRNLFSIDIVYRLYNAIWTESYSMWALRLDSFIQCNTLEVHPSGCGSSIVCSILFLRIWPSLFNHESTQGHFIIFSFGLSWIKLLWTFMYRLCLASFFISLGKCPGLQLLGHMVTIHLGFCRCVLFFFFTKFHSGFIIWHWNSNKSHFSASFLAFGIVTVFI